MRLDPAQMPHRFASRSVTQAGRVDPTPLDVYIDRQQVIVKRRLAGLPLTLVGFPRLRAHESREISRYRHLDPLDSYVIPPDLPLVPNPGEVDSWFEVPLSVLFDRSNYTENRAMWKGAERRFYEMHWEGYRIWGVTAAIIFNLSRRLEITESFGG
mgnify:CR=1 FL=1